MRVKKFIEDQLTSEEIKDAELESEIIIKSIESLRKSVSNEVKNILDSNKMSFNTLKKELGISSATLTKLSKGEGNITIKTIALLSQINNKVPFLTWK